jgi:hypothetical protein
LFSHHLARAQCAGLAAPDGPLQPATLHHWPCLCFVPQRNPSDTVPTFKFPCNVLQAINLWMAFTSPIGSQTGLFNVTIGQSSEPAVEADVLAT